jgi:hypothetical protein
MHKFKFLAKGMFSAVSAATVALGLTSLAGATQVVAPSLTPTGASINGSTQSVGAGSTFTFYGLYSDDNTNPESGLGVKVLYNGQHLTNATITEEYTKCRIAAGQVQDGTTTTAKAVMGWIDTALRPTGVVGTATGAVGWPNLADLTSGGCLNPGNINGAANAGDNAGAPAATSGTPLKLFRFNATVAASCTSSAACSSTVQIVSDGNFSYAGGTPGFTNQSFTIQGAAAPSIALAATDPIVSRKTHGSFVGEIPISATGVITGTGGASNATVEPRQATAGSPHRIVFKFTGANPTSVSGGNVTVAVSTGAAPTAATTFSGNEMIVELTGVTNGQRVQVTGNGINGSALNVGAVVGFLVGDVNNSRSVNSTDASQVRGQNLIAVGASNFKNDVNVNGAINSTDASVTRGQNLQVLQ